MTKNELLNIQIACDVVRSQCEELHALLLDKHPESAEKFERIAKYSGKISTCIRVHGQVPTERPKAAIVNVAKNVVEITRAVKKAAKNFPGMVGPNNE